MSPITISDLRMTHFYTSTPTAATSGADGAPLTTTTPDLITAQKIEGLIPFLKEKILKTFDEMKPQLGACTSAFKRNPEGTNCMAVSKLIETVTNIIRFVELEDQGELETSIIKIDSLIKFMESAKTALEIHVPNIHRLEARNIRNLETIIDSTKALKRKLDSKDFSDVPTFATTFLASINPVLINNKLITGLIRRFDDINSKISTFTEMDTTISNEAHKAIGVGPGLEISPNVRKQDAIIAAFHYLFFIIQHFQFDRSFLLLAIELVEILNQAIKEGNYIFTRQEQKLLIQFFTSCNDRNIKWLSKAFLRYLSTTIKNLNSDIIPPTSSTISHLFDSLLRIPIFIKQNNDLIHTLPKDYNPKEIMKPYMQYNPIHFPYFDLTFIISEIEKLDHVKRFLNRDEIAERFFNSATTKNNEVLQNANQTSQVTLDDFLTLIHIELQKIYFSSFPISSPDRARIRFKSINILLSPVQCPPSSDRLSTFNSHIAQILQTATEKTSRNYKKYIEACQVIENLLQNYKEISIGCIKESDGKSLLNYLFTQATCCTARTKVNLLLQLTKAKNDHEVSELSRSLASPVAFNHYCAPLINNLFISGEDKIAVHLFKMCEQLVENQKRIATIIEKGFLQEGGHPFESVWAEGTLCTLLLSSHIQLAASRQLPHVHYSGNELLFLNSVNEAMKQILEEIEAHNSITYIHFLTILHTALQYSCRCNGIFPTTEAGSNLIFRHLY